MSLQRHEQVALSARVYDVRSQIEVARTTVESLHELTELIRDGIVVTLEALGEELQEIEGRLAPPPIEMTAAAVGFHAPENGNVVPFKAA